MSFRSNFTNEDWLGLQTTFLLSWQGVAMADGAIDKEEDAIRESLVSGREAENLLPASVHKRLSSEVDLAREVLEFHGEDRRRFLTFVASTSDTRELAETALRIDEALPRWVNEAENNHDRGARERNAKGVLLEAFSYGLRVAKASGSRFGKKMSDVELRAVDRYGGQILELAPDDRIAVFNATGGHT
jgi:hypothetical protein